MAEPGYQADLETRAGLFAALGHPLRLLILNLVQQRPRHGEELAAILQIKPATVSHHVAKLVQAGLLQAEKDQYYQVYSLQHQSLDQLLSELVFMPQPGLNPRVAEDAYRTKVLAAFFVHGRLKQLPAQRKKRQVIMEHLAELFEPEREYTEREVTLALLDFSDDPVTLRRLLIEHELMQRQQGIYRRSAPGPIKN